MAFLSLGRGDNAPATNCCHRFLLAPELPGGQRRPLCQGPKFGPGNPGVDLVGPRTGAKAAVDPGNDVLPPQHSGITDKALCYYLGMLDDVRRRVDDPGDEHLARRGA